MWIIKAIINSFKEDWKKIKAILDGKATIDPRVLKGMFSAKKLFGDGGWMFFLLCIGFFFAGWFVAAKYYQNICNEYIFTNYIQPTIDNYAGNLTNFTINLKG